MQRPNNGTGHGSGQPEASVIAAATPAAATRDFEIGIRDLLHALQAMRIGDFSYACQAITSASRVRSLTRLMKSSAANQRMAQQLESSARRSAGRQDPEAG